MEVGPGSGEKAPPHNSFSKHPLTGEIQTFSRITNKLLDPQKKKRKNFVSIISNSLGTRSQLLDLQAWSQPSTSLGLSSSAEQVVCKPTAALPALIVLFIQWLYYQISV